MKLTGLSNSLRGFKHSSKNFQNKSYSRLMAWRYLFAWRKSQKKNGIDDELPWITFAAIDFLKATLKPNMKIFEFGSGGSTLFFADRVSEVISVEHNREWYQKVQEKLTERKIENVKLSLVEPEKSKNRNADYSAPLNYMSSSDEYKDYTFEKYAKSIELYPDEYFDVIFVDGRARPSCIYHSLKKVKKPGIIILDNAEREYYTSKLNLKFNKKDFSGPGPYNQYFWQTTVFFIE